MRKFQDHQRVVVFDFVSDNSSPGRVLGYKPARHDAEEAVYLVQADGATRAFWVAESLIEPMQLDIEGIPDINQVEEAVGMTQEQFAMVRLIDAAPELLSLLKEAVGMIRSNITPITYGSSAASLLEDCDSAIVKAEGGAA